MNVALTAEPETIKDDALNGMDAAELLEAAINRVHPGRIAAVSSFGRESGVLLHLIARVNPQTPILFLETGKLFPETLLYLHTLQQFLGLENVRLIGPSKADLNARDPQGTLWFSDPNACCFIRKVAPLQKALAPYAAWINGRKRFQSASRAAVPLVETDSEARQKYNPLARWSKDDIQNYMLAYDIPRHPLEAKGYTSIGCMPCTALPVIEGDERSGRWAGQDKTECGIHYAI